MKDVFLLGENKHKEKHNEVGKVLEKKLRAASDVILKRIKIRVI